MTTIDELRDLAFYVIRKLNDLIINFTTQQPQPQLRPRPQYRQMTEEERRKNDEIHEDIRRQIEQIQNRLTTPPPTPTQTEESRRIEKEREEFIEDLQKRISIKETVLNYLLSRLIKLRELKADNNIIMELEDEFVRLRLERQKLEENLVNVKNLK